MRKNQNGKGRGIKSLISSTHLSETVIQMERELEVIEKRRSELIEGLNFAGAHLKSFMNTKNSLPVAVPMAGVPESGNTKNEAKPSRRTRRANATTKRAGKPGKKTSKAGNKAKTTNKSKDADSKSTSNGKKTTVGKKRGPKAGTGKAKGAGASKVRSKSASEVAPATEAAVSTEQHHMNRYNSNATWNDKVLYATEKIGKPSSKQIIDFVMDHEKDQDRGFVARAVRQATTILTKNNKLSSEQSTEDARAHLYFIPAEK